MITPGTKKPTICSMLDGVEVCELVGLFMLHQMKHLFGCSNVGLYRDDSLAVLNNISGPKTDRTRKQLIKLFPDYDMKISVELKKYQKSLNSKTGSGISESRVFILEAFLLTLFKRIPQK